VVQNAEIFTLTYGSLVRQLITDLDNIDDVNKQLDTMYESLSILV
jgi:trafficking protein particle complex subunit 3